MDEREEWDIYLIPGCREFSFARCPLCNGILYLRYLPGGPGFDCHCKQQEREAEICKTE